MPESEKLLWHFLRKKRFFGHRVTKQKPLFGWIADFYMPQYKLVIEVDGGYHSTRKREDAIRDFVMVKNGLNVIRIPDNVVLNDIAKALHMIQSKINNLK